MASRKTLFVKELIKAEAGRTAVRPVSRVAALAETRVAQLCAQPQP